MRIVLTIICFPYLPAKMLMVPIVPIVPSYKHAGISHMFVHMFPSCFHIFPPIDASQMFSHIFSHTSPAYFPVRSISSSFGHQKLQNLWFPYLVFPAPIYHYHISSCIITIYLSIICVTSLPYIPYFPYISNRFSTFPSSPSLKNRVRSSRGRLLQASCDGLGIALQLQQAPQRRSKIFGVKDSLTIYIISMYIYI